MGLVQILESNYLMQWFLFSIENFNLLQRANEVVCFFLIYVFILILLLAKL